MNVEAWARVLTRALDLPSCPTCRGIKRMPAFWAGSGIRRKIPDVTSAV
jgi:hypothetical protein